MHEITNNQYAFAYATIWTIGAVATLAGALRDSSYHDVWRMLGACGCGGFLSLCAVGFLGARDPSSFCVDGSDCPNLGILTISTACGIGLLGKHSDQLLRWAVDKLTKGQVQIPSAQHEQNEPRDNPK